MVEYLCHVSCVVMSSAVRKRCFVPWHVSCAPEKCITGAWIIVHHSTFVTNCASQYLADKSCTTVPCWRLRLDGPLTTQQAMWPPGSADTVRPRPTLTLTFDHLTLKLVCEWHQRWGTFLPNLGMLGLWVLELFFAYVTDGQTDKSNTYWPFTYFRGHNRCTAECHVLDVLRVNTTFSDGTFAVASVRVWKDLSRRCHKVSLANA